MKKLFSFVFVVISTTIQSQELGLQFILTNSEQVSSTVMIGRDNSATVGIDADFNEENIYGIELNEVDLRSIQRIEDFHECLTSSLWNNSGNPMHFESNMDLKKDIRSMGLDSENSCFELELSAQGFPLDLNIDATNWDASSMYFFWIGLYDNNCNKVREIDLFNGETVNVEIQENDSVDRIIVKLNHEVSVHDSKLSLFEIIPNPISSNGIIRLSNISNGNIEIISIGGVKVYESRNQNEISISTTMLQSGLYLVKCSDNRGNVDVKKLVVK